jgi:hypothetical protein
MSFRERPFCHEAAHHRRLVIADKQDRLRDRTYIQNSYFKEMLMAQSRCLSDRAGRPSHDGSRRAARERSARL